MKITLKNELLLIVGLSLVAVVLLFLDSQLIKVIIGFPFILLVPGYTLTAALYPKTKDLTVPERLVLSFGFSMTIVPMLCLVLNYTPWGVRLYPVLGSIFFFILAMSAAAWYRRSTLPVHQRLQLSLELTFHWAQQSKRKKILQSLLAASIVLLLISLCCAANFPKGEENFTEFYILGEEGKAADYPLSLYSREEAEVTACVVNNENKKAYYRIEVVIGEDKVYESTLIALEHGEKWEDVVAFEPNTWGEKVKVEFLLFKAGEEKPEPYRKLHLWMDVK